MDVAEFAKIFADFKKRMSKDPYSGYVNGITFNRDSVADKWLIRVNLVKKLPKKLVLPEKIQCIEIKTQVIGRIKAH